MGLDPRKNAAKCQVSQGYNSVATTIQLASGEGSKLPSAGGFNLTWYNATDFSDSADDTNREIIRVPVGGISGDVLTGIARGQEDTTAKAHNIAGKTYLMVLAFTAKREDDIEDRIQDGAFSFAEDTGSADAYVVALNPALAAYVDGMPVRFRAENANTGASTLELNGLGAKDIKRRDGSDLTVGDIEAGQIVDVIFDEDNDWFQLTNTLATLTTKGDIQTYDSAPTRLPVGANGRILVASDAEATGLLWAEAVSPLVNMLLNGRFESWPEGTSFAAIASGYWADQWAYAKSGAGVHTASRSTSVPTVAQAGIKSNYSGRLEVTTADASIGASDFYVAYQPVEGYNFLQIAQRAAKLRFWARDSVTGIHCVSLSNSGQDRSLVLEFTIAAADTWEYFELDVPASPTAGTWDYTNGVGVYIVYAIAAGSNYQTTPGSWQTGLFYATANQVNGMATIGNAFQISDPVLVDGTVAPSPIRRHFTEEAKLLERYFEKTYNWDVTPGTADTGSNSGVIECRDSSGANGAHELRLTWQFRTRKRGAPTVTWYSGAGTAARADMVGGEQVATTLDVNECIASVAAANGASTDHFMRVRGKASARM